MKKYILTFYLFSTILISSTYEIVDENKIAISNAQIYNSIYGTTSDLDGFFYIEKNDCIEYKIDHIGFQKKIFNPCYSKAQIVLKKLSIPNDEIKIIGDLNKSKLKDIISNVEVFTETNILNSEKTSLEDILKASTNLNYSGVSSRPRYFQIRGIGEYEQYVSQGGPSYYVATYIDNFNYSGLAMAIPMFDVEQIEVFKGGQSFAFGQNALAGIIKINLIKPKPLKETKMKIELGSFDKTNLNIVHNQPINKNINLRLGISKNNDRGFIFNTHSNQYSNKRDELILNLQLSFRKFFKSGDYIDFNLSSMNSDLNNNYDRWSYTNFNNMQSFETHSNFGLLPNNESKDALKAQSNSIELNYKTKNGLKFTSIFSIDNIDLAHYYDADWSNIDQWSEDHPGIDYYDYAQTEDRNRRNKSTELKLSKLINSQNLTFGIFTKSLTERDIANGFVFWTNGGWASKFSSEYIIDYLSYYYQHIMNINNNFDLILNLRSDNYKNNYENNVETTNSSDFSNSESFEETFNSARIALKYKNIHLSITSNHKPGGFNQNPYVTNDYIEYLAEKTNTVELGFKNNNHNLSIDLNLFHMNRKDMQIDIADQADPSNPVTFYFYTTNIESGKNSGADLLLNYKLNKRFNLFLNCGLLKTYKDQFSYPSHIIAPNPVVISREQARAPKYTISTGIETQITKKIFTRFEILSKDEYYYFNNTDQVSKGYTIININSRYQITEKLDLSLSIKNATDERYGVHGFYFSVSGYEDRKFHESPANPRDISISLSYRL